MLALVGVGLIDFGINHLECYNPRLWTERFERVFLTRLKGRTFFFTHLHVVSERVELWYLLQERTKKLYILKGILLFVRVVKVNVVLDPTSFHFVFRWRQKIIQFETLGWVNDSFLLDWTNSLILDPMRKAWHNLQMLSCTDECSFEPLSDWILQAHVFGVASSASAGLSKHCITHKMT